MHVTSTLYLKMNRWKFKDNSEVLDVLNHPVLNCALAMQIIWSVFVCSLPHDKCEAECQHP